MEVKTTQSDQSRNSLAGYICLILYQNSMRTPQRSAFLPLFPVSCENGGLKGKAGGI
jgi:hypothetical protein